MKKIWRNSEDKNLYYFVNSFHYICLNKCAIVGAAKGPGEAKPEDKAKTPAKEESQEELAKAAQNPVADMVSFPLQNNIGFNFGPDKQTHSNPSVEISLRKSISSPKKTRPNSEPSRFTMPT